jgi:hypothetical protein
MGMLMRRHRVVKKEMPTKVIAAESKESPKKRGRPSKEVKDGPYEQAKA